MERYETELVIGIKAESYDAAVNEIVKKLDEIDNIYLIICDDTELEDEEKKMEFEEAHIGMLVDMNQKWFKDDYPLGYGMITHVVQNGLGQWVTVSPIKREKLGDTNFDEVIENNHCVQFSSECTLNYYDLSDLQPYTLKECKTKHKKENDGVNHPQQYGLTADAEKRCQIEVREAIKRAYDAAYKKLMDWRHEHGAEK